MKDKFSFSSGTGARDGRYLAKREGNTPTSTNQSSKVAIDNAKEQLADTTKRYMTARHSIVVKRYVIANE